MSIHFTEWIRVLPAAPSGQLPAASGHLQAIRRDDRRVDFRLVVNGSCHEWRGECQKNEIKIACHLLQRCLHDRAAGTATIAQARAKVLKESEHLWRMIVSDRSHEDVVRQTLASLDGKVLNIDVDDVALPWEFVGLPSADGSVHRMLGYSMHLVRTLKALPEPWRMHGVIPYDNRPTIGFVCDRSLPAAVDIELKYLREVEAQTLLALREYIGPDDLDDCDLVRASVVSIAADTQLLVFSVHGRGGDLRNGHRAAIKLPPNHWWEWVDIAETQPKLLSGPIVLLISCRAADRTEGFAPVSEAFYRWGARTVVAPEFAIPDSGAGKFSVRLLHHLLGGMSVGAAVFLARQDLRHDDEDIGLAFAVYANPEARLVKKGPVQ